MSLSVTLGVATYERDTYLHEAIASCLHQTYDDLEVLVVLYVPLHAARAEHRRRARQAVLEPAELVAWLAARSAAVAA